MSESDFETDVEGSSLVSGWARFGEFVLVGNGCVTNDGCGSFSSWRGCVRTELHGLMKFGKDGLKNYKDKVYVRRIRHSCDKPSCPVCFKHGWAVKEAENIEVRLLKGSKRWGLVEHIVVSVPTKDYGLKLGSLRNRVVKILRARGIVGGVMIFHGFRFANEVEARIKKVPFGWYWSQHFHVLGFICGGYECRSCHKPFCSRCNGFEALTRREFLKDGYIVKVAVDDDGVARKRKTVGGSAWYQLNHATMVEGSVRFHVATWFGVCSYRKLKVDRSERKKYVCLICGHDLVKLRYMGSKRLDLDESKDFVVDLCENGVPVWVEVVEERKSKFPMFHFR
jgi:hypothetical protein